MKLKQQAIALGIVQG